MRTSIFGKLRQFTSGWRTTLNIWIVFFVIVFSSLAFLCIFSKIVGTYDDDGNAIVPGTAKDNAFYEYSEFFPGEYANETDPRLKCTPEYNFSMYVDDAPERYLFCTVDADGKYFNSVNFTALDNTITWITFIPVDITYGDMYSFFGKPTHVSAGRVWKIVAWRQISNEDTLYNVTAQNHTFYGSRLNVTQSYNLFMKVDYLYMSIYQIKRVRGIG